MKSVYEDLSLTNVGGGSANELFLRELKEVIRNVKDPNTSTVAKRKITLEFEINPDHEGDYFDINISCASKLAKIVTAKTKIATDGRKAFHILKEKDMFENVKPIEKKGKK